MKWPFGSDQRRGGMPGLSAEGAEMRLREVKAAPMSPRVQYYGPEGQGHYTFGAIPVVPVQRETAMVTDGGPVWPDWDAAIALRHQRNLNVVDTRPAVPERLEPLAGAWGWGGFAAGHFGHFIAEHVNRVLPLISAFPGLPLLFTLPPGARSADVPAYFWQITRWLGLPPEQARFVTHPLRVETLHAVPMAEQWSGAPVEAAHLDRLDALPANLALAPGRDEVVYVARDGMGSRGEGNNAGEAYLCRLLEALNVRVMRPETLPLSEQLAIYKGARVLIFAEGSAMHGRQLLGRLDQHIVVLNRRRGQRIATNALRPRCTSLSYVETSNGSLSVLWPNGRPWIVRAKSVYDVDTLLGAFDMIGIDLGGRWDQRTYEGERDRDIRNWLAQRFAAKQPIDHAASAAAVAAEMRGLGLGHLVAEVPGLAAGGRA